jgi:broad specificity phosphatase PhoE
MEKRLILIRHAHRDTEVPSKDNGLSEKGEQQVKRLLRYFEKRIEGEVRFLSSPKKRCRETLGPLVVRYGGELEIDGRLTETGPIERQEELLARLGEFMDEWKYQGPDLLVACSHGDIIPVLVERLTGARIGIKKCGVVEIEFFAGDCYLTGLVQKPGE